MDRKNEKPKPWEKIDLGSEKLKVFFLIHLDRIYAAKYHLVSRLPSLARQAQYFKLKEAILKTVQDVEKQVARMQLIYTLLDAEVSTGSINGIIGLIDDAFEAIQAQEGEAELQDLSILFYLQNIESIEMASFQILQMAATGLKKHQIGKLLKEN